MKKMFCVTIEVYIEAPTKEAAQAIAIKGAEAFDGVSGPDADETQITMIEETENYKL